jgi:hypothetical protein
MAHALLETHTRTQTTWAQRIADPQWETYSRVIDAAHAAGIPFALGGAFALATQTGRWRDTKDLDIYVLPHDRQRMIDLTASLGMTDYYEKLPYDRWWIYRSTNGQTIIDIIWAMANHRAQIDCLWMSGPEVEIRGRYVKVLPAEALLWDKLYIMQRDRCDWPDVMNLLGAVGKDIDWEYVVERMGDDVPLLAGALSVYRWMAPGRAGELPGWLWEWLRLPATAGGSLPEVDTRRVSLLDTRAWFGDEEGKGTC